MQQKPNGYDSDFSFAIKRHIGVLSTTPRGWTKELNLVSYNGGRSKLDIRLWSEDHQKMGMVSAAYVRRHKKVRCFPQGI